MLRIRRSVKRKIGITVFSVVAGGGLLGIGGRFGAYRAERSYEEQLEAQRLRMENAGRLVYITTEEIKAGECFSPENTEQRYLLSEQEEEGLAKEVFGLASCADLVPGTIVNIALCGNPTLSESERECVFDDILQVEKFSDYSVVDVRIRYPNGENYCVLGKKVLRREEEDTEICRLSLTETEQLLMSAALYDAEVYEGTTLYAVAFFEERLQEEACSRYIPSEQVIMQLEKAEEDVGVTSVWYELRGALEERLLRNREQREADVF